MRGKSLADLSTVWDTVYGKGVDFVCLQELGGLTLPVNGWGHEEVFMAGQAYMAVLANPPDSFRGMAVLMPTHVFAQATRVQVLPAGLSVQLKQGGASTFVISLHYPHSQREDCMEVWYAQNSALQALLEHVRYFDSILIGADLNLELMHAPLSTSSSEDPDGRVVLLNFLVDELGLSHTFPDRATWTNSRGSESRIDYLLYRLPGQRTLRQEVHEDTAEILGSDHRLCTVCVQSALHIRRRWRGQPTKCGVWRVDAAKAVPLLDQSGADVDDADDAGPISQDVLESLAAQCCYRPVSCRYRDSPHIKELIRMRKRENGARARELGREIAQTRAREKREWRTSLLQRGAAGDYHAIAYFRRRHSVCATHTTYAFRAGGVEVAERDLRRFYDRKYSSTLLHPPAVPRAMLESALPNVPAPELITHLELEGVLATCKAGKSCGPDGMPYEFFSVALQTAFAPHIIDFFNSVLIGESQVPKRWLASQVALLPKQKEPSEPKHLRPIVLSSAAGKLFSKILILRLRPHFPAMTTGQLSGLPGAQTLDGSLALQRTVQLSQAWKLPLVIGKLDISQAFDTLEHAAISRFLTTLPAMQESRLLLDIITKSEVTLSICGRSWTQPLRRGVLQGSSYSAELFAHVLDHYIGPLLCQWENRGEHTWIRDPNTGRALYALIFADDIVLLATSQEQLSRMIQELGALLQTIGLRLSPEKCHYMKSPDLPERTIHPEGFPAPLQSTPTLLFLGILIGFGLSCQDTLRHRLVRTTHAFFGYFSFLCRCSAPLQKRLRLFDSFVTGKWKWLSAAIRPVSAVRRLLDVVQCNFLTMMAGLSLDPLSSATTSNWISRRKASKMAAQVCEHRPWSSAHMTCFMRYWGHAARMGPDAHHPIRKVLPLRGSAWLLVHEGTDRRTLGNWPDTSRYLDLAWRTVRRPTEPLFWHQQAQSRTAWDSFVHRWASHVLKTPDRWYPDVHCVDLHNRMLVQIGETFSLLPAVHPPVDEPYEASFKQIPTSTCDEDPPEGFQIACDGSAKDDRGGIGVVVLPPYGTLPGDEVYCQQALPGRCTNNRAEMHAATKALQMADVLLKHCPHVPVTLCIDSLLVLQILEGQAHTTIWAGELAGLLSQWTKVRGRVDLRHVRSHQGHPLNEAADRAAGAARDFPHHRVVYRNAQYSRSFFTGNSEVPTRLPTLW